MSVQITRGYFERPYQSFSIDPRSLDWILADVANPLNRLAHIIPKGARVLDVGAGNGVLGRLLRRVHGDVIIDGVEPDPAAATFAVPYYRNFFKTSVETFLDENQGSVAYDYVVMADVIEHLVHPDHVLQRLVQNVGSSAKICLSTPNIAFLPVRVALLHGVFDYVDSGILERTHLRFFTLHTLKQLFGAVRLMPEITLLLERDPLSMEIRLQDFSVNPFLLSKLLRDDLACVYQFLFVLSAETGNAVVERIGDPGRAVVWRYLRSRVAINFTHALRKAHETRHS